MESYLATRINPSIINYFNELSYTASPELRKLTDLPADQLKNISLADIIKKKKFQLEHRNKIYGFSLDRIDASKFLNNQSGLTRR